MGRISFRRYLMGAHNARAFGVASLDRCCDSQWRDWWSRPLRKISSRFAIAIAPDLGSLRLLALRLESRNILESSRKRLQRARDSSFLACRIPRDGGGELGGSFAQLWQCKNKRAVGRCWAFSDHWRGSAGISPRLPDSPRDQNKLIEFWALMICSNRAYIHHQTKKALKN